MVLKKSQVQINVVFHDQHSNRDFKKSALVKGKGGKRQFLATYHKEKLVQYVKFRAKREGVEVPQGALRITKRVVYSLSCCTH